MKEDPPILLIIFNRVTHTQRVFDEIKLQRPSKLFISADGPRPEIKDDVSSCETTRSIIEQINWQCELHKLYHTENIGCRKAVIGAIDWFFEYVEEGVILEDDCLPSRSFFSFCGEMLERYKKNSIIMHINGTCYIEGYSVLNASYYFSKLSGCWGWATWKRAWQLNDPSMTGYRDMKKNGELLKYYKNPKICSWITSYYDEAVMPSCKIWSTVWAYAILKNNGLCINPTVNLVQNIGFDEAGTTKAYKSFTVYSNYSAKNISEIIHPKHICHDVDADVIYYNSVIKKTDPKCGMKYRFIKRLKALTNKLVKSPKQTIK